MSQLRAVAHNSNLEAAAADLVKALGGIWSPSGAMCHCPAHDDRTPSLSVRIGEHNLLFKCFAGCPTPEVLRAIRRRRLDVPQQRADDCGKAKFDSPNIALANRAREIWASATAIDRSPAERYLASRGLAVKSTALRFHPRTPLGRGRMVAFRPALIAAIHDRDLLVAIQRIFLDPDRALLAADLENPKRALGRPLAGAVILAPATATLGLAEGVETALSAQWLLDLPVWAVLGNERLARVAVPDFVTRLLLLPDNDAAGRRSEARAHVAHARPGRVIETIWPSETMNDWNDVLRAEGKEAGDRARQVA